MTKPDIWIRHEMDRVTRELVDNINPTNRSVCEISGDVWHDVFDWKAYESLTYPEFDICQTPFSSRFDLIVVEQVLEHVRYPDLAVKNIFKGLNPGGYALITTPFMFHIHPTPLDCWRWTPQGMGFLLEDAGFLPADITVGGWGNYECFLRHAIEQTAPAMDAQFSLRNDPHIPIMVWGFARKNNFDR